MQRCRSRAATARRSATRRARRSPADKVRFVGDPVACVVAETLAQAKDAAEAVVARYRAAARGDERARGGQARRAAAL